MAAIGTSRRSVRDYLVLTLAVLVALLMLSPFLLLVLNAFKTTADYSTRGPLAWPAELSLDGFTGYLERVDFPLALVNSIVISSAVAFAAVSLALLASYGIGIGRVRGSTAIVALLLVATMLPHEALIYPLFYGAQATGTLNTIWSVIIVFTVLHTAFGTYILSSVMGTAPPALREAAQIDGASRWQILWKVITPVLRPTLSVLVVFFFLFQRTLSRGVTAGAVK